MHLPIVISILLSSWIHSFCVAQQREMGVQDNLGSERRSQIATSNLGQVEIKGKVNFLEWFWLIFKSLHHKHR